MIHKISYILLVIFISGCESFTGPWLMNLNEYVVSVGFDTRNEQQLQLVSTTEGLSNIGVDHQLLYVKRDNIGGDPLEFDLSEMQTTNLESIIFVLKGQKLYLVPAEKGDFLEGSNLGSLSVEVLAPLH